MWNTVQFHILSTDFVTTKQIRLLRLYNHTTRSKGKPIVNSSERTEIPSDLLNLEQRSLFDRYLTLEGSCSLRMAQIVSKSSQEVCWIVFGTLVVLLCSYLSDFRDIACGCWPPYLNNLFLEASSYSSVFFSLHEVEKNGFTVVALRDGV